MRGLENRHLGRPPIVVGVIHVPVRVGKRTKREFAHVGVHVLQVRIHAVPYRPQPSPSDTFFVAAAGRASAFLGPFNGSCNCGSCPYLRSSEMTWSQRPKTAARTWSSSCVAFVRASSGRSGRQWTARRDPSKVWRTPFDHPLPA